MLIIKISHSVAFNIIAFYLVFLVLPCDTRAQQVPEPRLKWQFQVGYGSLVVGNGMVYVSSPTGCTDYVPCGPPARLFALDIETGKQKWMLTGLGSDSTPVVVGSTVYQSSGYLYALDSQTGTEKWKFRSGNNIHYSSVIISEVAYVWGINVFIPGGYFGGDLYAVNLKTQKKKWSFPVTDGMVTPPMLANGIIYFANNAQFSKNSLYAVDAQSGKEKWKLYTNITAAPTVFDEVIYYGGEDGFLHALDAKTGRELWKTKMTNNIGTAPVVERNLIYLSAYNSSLEAVDLKTKKQKWEFKNSKPMLSSPIVANGVIYFGCTDQHLYALNAETGQEIWKFKTQGYLTSSPIIDKGVVYLGTSLSEGNHTDGYVYAIALP